MEKLTINTGLDRFLLLDRITDVTERTIQGIALLSEEMPVYLLVEAMAQLGAMHVRFVTDFGCHAFLLGISNLCMADTHWHPEGFAMTGSLENRSTAGFSYTVTTEIRGGHPIAGAFLYATIPYDEMFRRDRLKHHYEKVFSCLHNVS